MKILIYFYLACLRICSAMICYDYTSENIDLTRSFLSQGISEDQLQSSWGNDITDARSEGISKCDSSPNSSINLIRTYGSLNEEARSVTQTCGIFTRIKHKASQWWKKNLNLIPRMDRSDHYSIYFGLVESVIQESNNQFIISLAKNMSGLQSDLLSKTTFRSSKNINENITIYSIYLALAALEDSTLLAKERYWVLGILECIQCNARQISKEHIYTLRTKDKISRGELELYLIKGKIQADKVKELWEHSQTEDLDNDMREVLKRVELLTRMFVESEMTTEAPVVTDFKKIYDQMLLSRLPLQREQLALMIKSIKRLIVENDVPFKQKSLIHELCWHLHIYSKRFRNNLEHLLAIDEEFSECFYKFRAKESLDRIIRSYQSNIRMRRILLPFTKAETITTDQLPLILIPSQNYLLKEEERLDIFKAVVAASILNNEVSVNVSKKLSRYTRLPWEVVELASRFDVDPDFPGVATLDFEYLIFLKHPGLLDAAQRARYVEVLYESNNRRLTRAERLMSDLPWIKDPKNEAGSCKAFDAMMLQITRQYKSDRKAHVLNLESLRHIFKTAQRRIGNKLIKMIQRDMILANHLREVSNDILLGNVTTSGVSELRVKNFAEWLMSIIGYYHPSPEDHMRPMKPIERWYSIEKY